MGRHTTRRFIWTASRATGRHRLGRSGGVRCYDLPAVAWFWHLRSHAAPPAARTARHSWAFLARNGGSPRPAFALILSL